MADEERDDTDGKPPPGPGVTNWLAHVLGTPRQSKALHTPVLPTGFGPKIQARRIDVALPEEVVVADGGTLQRIEIRGLPAGVTLSGGEATTDGYWHLAPEDLYGIAAIVPENVGLPFSVMLKGVFIGDDPETPWTELTGYEFTDAAARDIVIERATPSTDEESQPESASTSESDEVAVPETTSVPGAAREQETDSEESSGTSEPDEVGSGPEPDSEVPTSLPDVASITSVREEIEPTEEIAALEAEPEPAPDSGMVDESTPTSGPEPEPVAEPVTMVVIDLDVSVGTEVPAVLKNITLHFSGLPERAWLTQGHNDLGHNDLDRWSVPASELSALAIVIPERTNDFDLDVEMEIAGAAPQSATIHVENPPQFTDPSQAFEVTMSASRDTEPTRINIYSDGVSVFDRVINWAAAPDNGVGLMVPLADSGIPFEILMRYESLGDKSGQPLLAGILIDGTNIAPTAAAISANGSITDNGLSWTGDLVIDVRAALKSPAGGAEPGLGDIPEQGALAHEPAEMSEPAAMRNIDTPVTNGTDDPEDILAPATPPAPVYDIPPEGDVADTGSASDDDVTIGAPTTRTEERAAGDAPSPTGGVLIVDATFSDLQRPAFIDELRNLRDFIRTRPADHSGEIYGRLGIDVTKWHDMKVRGPGGADVNLEPGYPLLAPRGGLDNTREVLPMNLTGLNGVSDVDVRISGLPPGALLTHGRNLGGGVWRLNAGECDVCALLPPIGRTHSLPVHVGWRGQRRGDSPIPPRKSLVFNMPMARPAFPGTDVQSMNLVLTAEDFDTGGHGALSLTVGEMPPGVLLSRGKNHGGGVWTLEANTGDSLAVMAAAAMPSFQITLTCVALNPATGDSTVVSRILDVYPASGKVRVRTELAA